MSQPEITPTTSPTPREGSAAPVPTESLTGWADIDLAAIRANVERLDELSGDAAVMAVLKADAYGHGLLPVARAALAGGATHLAVAQLSEALAARAAGITAPLLTWLYPPGADLEPAVAADLILSAGTPWSLDLIADGARRAGRTATVHLKVDSGLGRGGAWGEDLAEMFLQAARLEAEGVIDVEGMWSHFAWADAPAHPTVQRQREVFLEAVGDAERAGLRPRIRHLANSAATLTNPDAHLDMVRPGLAVYGLSPTPDIGGPPHFGLTEAMRLTARLVNVKDAPAGQGVSYGHEYTTPQATRLGLVPLGYADGIPRAGGNVGPMALGGDRLQVAGRVCMDQVVLDLGPGSDAAAGDEVVILGREADGEPTAQDWAAATGTINYEIVTRLGARVPRRYLGEVG